MQVLRALAMVGAIGPVAGLAAPAPALARDVTVPLRAEIEPTLSPQLMSALRLEVRVPRDTRVSATARRRGVAVLTSTRGRCVVRVGLIAETVPSRRGLTHGRRTSPVALRDADGTVRNMPARLWGPRTAEGQRLAVRIFDLPATTLPHFPGRTVLLEALQANRARHCAKRALDRALRAALAHPHLTVTGDYPADDPVPVVDVAPLPRLTLAGYQANGQFGSPMASVGDTDGDGRPELAIYDLRADITDLVDISAVEGTVSLADPGAATLRLIGVGDLTPVVPAGDVDGDGRQDLAVIDGPPSPHQLGAHVILGRPGPATVDPKAPGTAYITLLGPGRCRAIQSINSILAPGDMDGDGVGDLVAATTCADVATLWLIPGGRGPGTVTLGADDGRSFALARNRALTVDAVGDVNGDGLADLAVDTRADGRTRVTVVFGAAAHTPVTLRAPAPRGFVIQAGRCRDLRSTGPAGDVNGDGRADILITTGDECGVPSAAVVFGSASAGRVDLTRLIRAGRGITLDTYADGLGTDVTGDGLADLVVNGQNDLIYVVDGRRQAAALQLRRLGAGGRAYRVPKGSAGAFVAGAIAVPDVDGDGRPELAFSTPYLDVGGLTAAGGVQVLGSSALPPG